MRAEAAGRSRDNEQLCVGRADHGARAHVDVGADGLGEAALSVEAATYERRHARRPEDDSEQLLIHGVDEERDPAIEVVERRNAEILRGAIRAVDVAAKELR